MRWIVTWKMTIIISCWFLISYVMNVTGVSIKTHQVPKLDLINDNMNFIDSWEYSSLSIISNAWGAWDKFINVSGKFCARAATTNLSIEVFTPWIASLRHLTSNIGVVNSLDICCRGLTIILYSGLNGTKHIFSSISFELFICDSSIDIRFHFFVNSCIISLPFK